MIRKSSCLLLPYFFLLFEKKTHKKGGGRNDNSIVLFVSLEKEGLWSNDYRNMHKHTHTYTHMHTHNTRAPCEFWDMNSLPKEPTKSLFFYSTSIFYFSLKTLVKKSSRLKLLIDECDYKTNQLDSKIIQIAKKIFGSRFLTKFKYRVFIFDEIRNLDLSFMWDGHVLLKVRSEASQDNK
jgi:hypothetical protein